MTQQAAAMNTDNKPTITTPQEKMRELVALCKRRGFIFPASDIYNGLNGFWDFGPLGVELRNNLRDAWWRDMVLCPPLGPDGEVLSIVGLDSAIIQNPQAWVASGHVDGFSDPMVDCKESKLRYRADHVKVLQPKDGKGISFAFLEDDAALAKRIKKFGEGKTRDDYNVAELVDLPASDYTNILAPEATKPGTLTEPRAFNLMFQTYIGATASKDDVAYLRPETAQGIFLNYKNVMASSRVKVPFGIAQIGKAFRNEVTPRNFIYRTREFEQMEMEWFCHADDAKKWLDFWIETRKAWWQSVGVKVESLQIRQHEQDELSHYAKTGEGVFDIEFKFPFTDPEFGELEGIAHRSNFDLSTHEIHSKTKMEYVDQENNRRFIPHVIEPAAGLTRGVLALLADSFVIDPARPSGMFLQFKPSMAPIKAAILPLVNKDGLPEMAQKLYMELRKSYPIELDAKQSIGKRYARHDEIGTPFCCTIDHDSLNDQSVTVRHRDTMQQERISFDQLKAFLDKHLAS